MPLNRAMFRRKRFEVSGAPPVFTPLSIAGCVLWLDGSDPATMPNTPVIDSWLDKSPFNNDCVPVGSHAFYPQLSTWNLNANSCVDFVTANQGMLQIVASASLVNGSYSLYSVFQSYLALDGDGIVVLFGSPTSCQLTIYPYVSGGSDVWYEPTCNGVSDEWPYPFSVPQYILSSSRMDVDVLTIRLNQALLTTESGCLTDLININQFYLGGFSAGNFFANHGLGEMIVYNSALSDADNLTVENYLQTKWSLP